MANQFAGMFGQRKPQMGGGMMGPQGAPPPSFGRAPGGPPAGMMGASRMQPQPGPMGAGAMAARQVGRPQPMGGMPGAMGGMGAPSAPMPVGPQQAPRAPAFGGQLAGQFALSDENSKEKIRELEAVRDRYEGLMGTDRDDTGNAFRGVHDYEYEYKDPGAPGAAPGKRRGPMAHELRPLGVTARGGDGMERVDMQRLPLETAGEVGNQRRELDALRERLRSLEGNPGAQLDVAGGRS